MVKKWSLFLGGAGVFLLFVVFSFLVHRNLFVHFDFNSTVRLQDHISHRFDTFFSIFSVLGSFEVSGVFLLLLAGALFFTKRRLGAMLSVVSFGIILCFELFGKVFISHPGPPILLARYQQFFVFPTDYIPHPSSSYPSGHAGRTLFLSTLLLILLFQNKRLSWGAKLGLALVLVLYDVIMVLSRVYLGEHWTSDVIGGVLLGVSLALMTFEFMQGKKVKLKNLFFK